MKNVPNLNKFRVLVVLAKGDEIDDAMRIKFSVESTSTFIRTVCHELSFIFRPEFASKPESTKTRIYTTRHLSRKTVQIMIAPKMSHIL